MTPWRVLCGIVLLAVVVALCWVANVAGYNQAYDRFAQAKRVQSRGSAPTVTTPPAPVLTPEREAIEPEVETEPEEVRTETVYVPVEAKPKTVVVEKRVPVPRGDCALDARRVRRLNEAFELSGPDS